MDSPYKILIIGSYKSGKTTLCHAIRKYIINNEIRMSLNFLKLSIKNISKKSLQDNNMILFVIDHQQLNNGGKVEYILGILNLMNLLLEKEQKLLLVINKCDDFNNNNKSVQKLFANYEIFRCSSAKMFLENIVKNRIRMDVHQYRCRMWSAIRELGDLKLDIDFFENTRCEIYGDWDNLIKTIIINYNNLNGIKSKL